MIPHSRPTLTIPDANAVQQSILEGFVGRGARVQAFERALSQYAGRQFARATSSGSAALHLALLALDVKNGDEVILPAFLCRAVLNVVLAVGAAPVLVDIDPVDFTLSPEAVHNALSPNTAAIIAPHMFGAPADMNALLEFGVPVIEDAASSPGATYHQKPVGSFGVISIYSFASTKMMTTGQGGMVLTDDARILAHIERLMDYDSVAHDTTVAFNYTYTDPQAALGLAQFAQLDTFVARRRALAKDFSETLQNSFHITLPRARPLSEHGFYRYIFLADNAREIVNALRADGVDARTSVSHFLYDYLDQNTAQFPNCEFVRERIVSVPIYPSLTDAERVHIIAALVRACRAGGAS